MLNRVAHFLLKRNRNAAMLAFLCSIAPLFLGTISVIIVALVALRKGARDSFLVLAWGVLPVLARAFVDKSYLLFTTALLAFLLAWSMSLVLRYTRSWTLLLNLCIWLSFCIVCLSFVFQSQIESWWIKQIHAYIYMMQDQGIIQAADEKFSEVQIQALASISSGVEVFLLLLMAGFKVVIARWWEGTLLKTRRCRQELLQLSITPWSALLLILLLLATLIFKEILLVSILIPVVGFCVIAGLCLLHYWMQEYKYAGLALIGFYIVLIIFPYIAVLPLLLGLLDSGINVRVKLIKKEV